MPMLGSACFNGVIAMVEEGEIKIDNLVIKPCFWSCGEEWAKRNGLSVKGRDDGIMRDRLSTKARYDGGIRGMGGDESFIFWWINH